MVSEPFGSLDAQFRNRVYETLARHESIFNLINNNLHQIRNNLQTVLTELRTLRVNRNGNTAKVELNPFISVETVHSPNISPPTQISTIILKPWPDEPPKDTDPKPKTNSTTQITEAVSQKSKQAKKGKHYQYQLQVRMKFVDRLRAFQMADRNREQFRHRNLPTPTRAAVSAAFKLHHTVHCISSTAVTTAVVPLPVFDPGGNGSFEEEGLARLQAWWNFSHFGRIFEGFRRQIGKSDRWFSEKRRIGKFFIGIEELEKKIWGFFC